MFQYEKRDMLARQVATLLCKNLNLQIVSFNLFSEAITIGTKHEYAGTENSYIIRYHEDNTYIDNIDFLMLGHRTTIRNDKSATGLSTKELFEEYNNDKLFALETVNDLRSVKTLLEAVPIEVLCEFFEIKL